MRRAAATLLLLAACGQSQLPPFGQLHAPGGITVNVPTGRLFVASETADELRVLDTSRNDPFFLSAPNKLFPLSIPTVHWPTAVASGQRFVFVLSSIEAELGFVDATVDPPASIDVGTGLARLPLTLPLDMVPSSVAALGSVYAADRALVAGVDAAQQGQVRVVVTAQPPAAVGTPPEDLPFVPAVEDTIALPGAFPFDVQVEPGVDAAVLGPGGDPVEDCRVVAVADGRSEPGHTPGVILFRVSVAADDGSFAVVSPPQSFAVPVSVNLGQGRSETRDAPVKAVAFVPAPIDQVLPSVPADPCAPRSGRLIAVLDPVYCGTDLPCRDVAFLDLGQDPSGALTLDVASDVQGGDAIYDVPGVALGAAVAEGPFSLAPRGSSFKGGFSPVGGDPITKAPSMAFVTSSDRSVYLIASGLGTLPIAPGTRAASDPVTRVDADPGSPLVTEPKRGSGATDLVGPTVVVEGVTPEPQPITQSWVASFRGTIPGFASVADVADLVPVAAVPVEVTLSAPLGLVTFRLPIAVVPGDVLLPRPGGGVVCAGFDVSEVAADGSSLRATARDQTDDPASCSVASTQLDLVPSEANPWLLTGSRTGFAGRLPPLSGSGVFDGTDLQFVFVPPPLPKVGAVPQVIPPGTAWTFETRSGFTFLGAAPDPNATTVLLPSAIVAIPPTVPLSSGFRTFITYSGSNSVLAIDPNRPAPGLLGLFE